MKMSFDNFLSYNYIHQENECRRIVDSVKQYFVFTENQLNEIEMNVNNIIQQAENGELKQFTIDRSPLRNKYFFGERYTYGIKSTFSGLGTERLYPKHYVDPIPNWIIQSIINPLTEARIIPKNFVNSVVINDYQPGGCIVSHIDPPHIFDRPLISFNLFSDSALCFGCKFEFKPIRCSEPIYKLNLPRGVITSLSGYAANEITHCIRPQDVVQRRAVIMLRRTHQFSPRLTGPTYGIENLHDGIFRSQFNIDMSLNEFATLYRNRRKLNFHSQSGRIQKKTYQK